MTGHLPTITPLPSITVAKLQFKSTCQVGWLLGLHRDRNAYKDVMRTTRLPLAGFSESIDGEWHNVIITQTHLLGSCCPLMQILQKITLAY
jgi:hypothetical protein